MKPNRLLNCSEAFYLVWKNHYLAESFCRTSPNNRHRFLVPIAHFPYEKKKIIEKTLLSQKTNLRSFKHCVKYRIILSNFLVWKFCGKALFPQIFGQIANFHTRKFGEISGFYAVKAATDESFISRFNLHCEQVYFLV